MEFQSVFPIHWTLQTRPVNLTVTAPTQSIQNSGWVTDIQPDDITVNVHCHEHHVKNTKPCYEI